MANRKSKLDNYFKYDVKSLELDQTNIRKYILFMKLI